MSKAMSPFDASYRNTCGDPPRSGHRRGPFVATCEAVLGYPDCIAEAAGRDCTQLLDLQTLKPVTKEQHAECERQAAEAFRERDGRPCDDCAFRPGSPEMRDELTLTVALQDVPFRCHQGMPLRYFGEEEWGEKKVSYEPGDPLGTTYPICNGWAFFKALDDKEAAIDAICEAIA